MLCIFTTIKNIFENNKFKSPTAKTQFENSKASKIPSRSEVYLCEYEKK